VKATHLTHMTCEEITQRELMERYLLGQLEQPERDAFDEHLFECEACFERLQTLRAVRRELAATAGALRAEPERASRGWIWKWAFVPTFATLVIVSVMVWPRVFQSPDSPGAPPATPAGRPAGGVGTPPSGQPPAGQPSSGQAPSVGVSLAELGRFEAPPYAAGSLRGSQDAAASRFREGMTQYARGDYRAAIAGLRAAARLDPEAAHASFFLGVSYVLDGQHDEGMRALRQTITLGDSPYLEEAHFYLAKTLLQRNDPVAARQELTRTTELKGPLEQQARRLLDDLDRRQASRP
jgi:anti-sigma factor RsiW